MIYQQIDIPKTLILRQRTQTARSPKSCLSSMRRNRRIIIPPVFFVHLYGKIKQLDSELFQVFLLFFPTDYLLFIADFRLTTPKLTCVIQIMAHIPRVLVPVKQRPGIQTACTALPLLFHVSPPLSSLSIANPASPSPLPFALSPQASYPISPLGKMNIRSCRPKGCWQKRAVHGLIFIHAVHAANALFPLSTHVEPFYSPPRSFLCPEYHPVLPFVNHIHSHLFSFFHSTIAIALARGTKTPCDKAHLLPPATLPQPHFLNHTSSTTLPQPHFLNHTSSTTLPHLSA